MRSLSHDLARVLARITFFCGASLACSSGFIPNVAHAQAHPFSLAITGPKSAITFGSQCDVLVTVTNISADTIAIAENNDPKEGFKDYKIIMTDEASGTMLKQDLSKVEPRGPKYYQHSSDKTKYLQRGDSIVQRLPVCSLYALSADRKYNVQVERNIPRILGAGTVASNTIEIAVAP